MIIQKETRNLIKELAEEFNLPFDTVREIVYFQFKYIRKELESGVRGEPSSYKNILLRYLGTFYTRDIRIIKLAEIMKKKNEEFNTEL